MAVSSLHPGATEEVCVPEIEKVSGLAFNRDFYAGYSPERINPGDKTHRLPAIVKVTSGSTPEAAKLVETREVLEAAGTKWNFQAFLPGLVGGHHWCRPVLPHLQGRSTRK
jgi:UDP-N-acetyl-D-glucosamine/UDP-N-acetyl-D-galactosamine dehydrogenase